MCLVGLMARRVLHCNRLEDVALVLYIDSVTPSSYPVSGCSAVLRTVPPTKFPVTGGQPSGRENSE